MTEEVKKLVESLREDAEWAQANEWETPITLGDNLTAAADMIEKLSTDLETTCHRLARSMQEQDDWKLRAKAAEHDMRKAIMGTGSPCKSCKYPIQDDAPCSVCDCVSHWQWRGPCAENRVQEEES